MAKCVAVARAKIHIFDNDTSDDIQSFMTVQDRCGQCTELSSVCFILISGNKSLSIYWWIVIGRYFFCTNIEKGLMGYMNNKSLVRYNLQLSYLAKLKDKKLITEEEHRKILESLKKDYKVISNHFS